MSSQPKKVELHVHLSGAVRHSTLWENAKKLGHPLPGSGTLQDLIDATVIKVPKNLNNFLSPYQIFASIYSGNYKLLERIAYEYCEDAVNNGVAYLELRYSPRKCLGEEKFKQVGFEGLCEVVKTISQGIRRAEGNFDIKVKTILSVFHGYNFNDEYSVLRLCQKYYDLGVVGIDLCTAQPEEGFVEEAPLTEDLLRIFREASQTSVHRTIHAGEASGSSAIERAVYKLGAERVGHGYHIVKDEKLYARCLLDNVHFECCPYSSLLTGAVKEGGPTHPIVKFARDKANFSLNSDDPTLTGYYLNDDYNLAKSWGLEDSHLAAANINAAKSSFLPEDEKKALVKKIVQSYPAEVL